MESYRILGSIKLEPGRLVLTAQGKERFAIGKRLLENILQKSDQTSNRCRPVT